MGELAIIRKLRAAQAEIRLLKEAAIRNLIERSADQQEIRFLNWLLARPGHGDSKLVEPTPRSKGRE
jgi:hypothetical protein